MPPKKGRKSTVPPGRAYTYLIEHFTLPTNPSEKVLCQIGHVLRLYNDNYKNPKSTLDSISEYFGFTPTYNQLNCVLSRVGPLIKNYGRESCRKQFEDICNEDFIEKYPPPPSATVLASKQEMSTLSSEIEVSPPPMHSTEKPPAYQAGPFPSTSVDPGPSTLFDPGPSTSFDPCLSSSTSYDPFSSTSFSPVLSKSTDPIPFTSTPKRRLRSSDYTPRKKKLFARISLQAKLHSEVLARQKEKMKAINLRSVSAPSKLKQAKATIQRRDVTLTVLKKMLREKRTPDSVWEKKINEIKKQKKESKRKHAEEMAATKVECNRKLKEKDAKIRSLEKKLEITEKQQETAAKEQHPTKKDKKTYSTQMRMAVYDCILNNVPTSNIPELLPSVAKRFGIELNKKDVPQKTTIEQMVRELGVIGDLQAAEKAIETPNLTLGFDATTQEGVHINTIHFTTKDECQVIAVDQLAGGTAEDYATHIIETIDHLADVYSEVHKQDYQETRQKLIDNITNTMTDRAAVNHATINKINVAWGKSLNELNCNLHPLDTITNSCRSALKSLQPEDHKGAVYGNDCIAANVVLGMNKARFKDGKGDPRGFTTFLHDKKLPKGLIPRYRGNRLHVLFATCTVFVKHYKALIDFLGSKVLSCTHLSSSLHKDFSSDIFYKQICVLAVIGKLFSGPWMKVFYTPAGGPVDYVESIDIIKRVLAAVVQVSKEPMSLLDTNTDFFGNPLDDIAESILRVCPKDKEVQDMILGCLAAIITVLERQYKRQFDMDLTPELKKATESARLHNIDAEEVVGMFSAAQLRARSATLCYISAKLRSVKNHVIKYLDCMDEKTRSQLISWSVKKSRSRREENRQKHADLRKELSRRSADKQQKKEQRERKGLEEALKDLTVIDIKSEFHLEAKPYSDLCDIMQDTVVGRDLCHLWSEEGETVFYYGRVEKLRKDKNVYVVSYWNPDAEEAYDDAVEYDIPKPQLMADIVFGDLILS